MKKSHIIGIIVGLVVALTCVGGVLALTLSGPAGIVDPVNLVDLTSPSEDVFQSQLQKYTKENYYTYKNRMFSLLKAEEEKLSVNDFCSEVYFSEPKWSTYSKSYHVILYSKTGFYVGPVVFLDDQGNEVDRIDVAISSNVGIQMNAEDADYTLVTLDEINPRFKEEFTWFDVK